MDKHEVVRKWLSAFAADVDKKDLAAHVLAEGNFLWHIFSYEYVSCLTEEKAQKAFDRLEYDTAYCFESGYTCFQNDCAWDTETLIDNFREIKKTTSAQLQTCGDVYIVDKDFKWTYVHTHEGDCGPYFCRID